MFFILHVTDGIKSRFTSVILSDSRIYIRISFTGISIFEHSRSFPTALNTFHMSPFTGRVQSFLSLKSIMIEQTHRENGYLKGMIYYSKLILFKSLVMRFLILFVLFHITRNLEMLQTLK